jgi:hypothetical protein
MQAVTLFCEMLNNSFGMSARWLIANWEADGMFYYKSPPDAGIPLWNPRPDFYYTYYLPRVIGDHVLNASVAGGSYVHAYATRFTSGHTGLVVVNASPSTYVVTVNPQNIGVGDRFYVYTLTGIDNTTWPQGVVVNGHLPSGAAWGPLDSLQSIPAAAYPIGDTIRFSSPPRSVSYVLLDEGNRILSSVPGDNGTVIRHFTLGQNYPNPFNPTTTVSYQLPAVSEVRIVVSDILGREVATLLNEAKPPGNYTVTWDASRCASGMYFCTMSAGAFHETRKLILMK